MCFVLLHLSPKTRGWKLSALSCIQPPYCRCKRHTQYTIHPLYLCFWEHLHHPLLIISVCRSQWSYFCCIQKFLLFKWQELLFLKALHKMFRLRFSRLAIFHRTCVSESPENVIVGIFKGRGGGGGGNGKPGCKYRPALLETPASPCRT